LILVLFYNVSPESLAKPFLLRKTVADIDEFGPSSPNRLRKGLETCIQHSLHPTEKTHPRKPCPQIVVLDISAHLPAYRDPREWILLKGISVRSENP
jgi:hypothetical protein